MDTPVSPSRVVLTNENAAEFYAHKMSPMPEPVTPPPAEPAKAPAAAEAPAVESAKPEGAESAVEEASDTQVPNPEARQKLNLRFSELTQKIKAAEAKAAENEAKVKAAEEARVLAERQAAELRTKYEPPKADELGPEPQRTQFVSDAEYIEALKEWSGDKAVRERDQKAAQEAIRKSWDERQAKAKAEIPSYDADIAAASHLAVSDQVRDAILASEVGPKILHYLATNPAIVSELARMRATQAVLEIGRLDAKFSLPAAPKAEPKPEPKVTPASESPRAPAEPISPLRGNSAPSDAPIDGDGNVTRPMTAAEWRAMRKAGKIK